MPRDDRAVHAAQRAADTTTAQSQTIDLNLLIGLSWLGEITAEQIQRIWFPHRQGSTVRWRLQQLKRLNLITTRYQYTVTPHAPTPRRTAAAWSLTDKGLALVETCNPAIARDRYIPPRPKVLMNHDLFTSEIVTRIIELARPSCLSGLTVYRENRIDPRYRRPVVDALIVVRYDPKEPADPHHVPWTKDPLLKTEHSRRWALENDRGTEALNILAGKAEHYKQADSLEWRTLNDTFPVPLLVTTSQRRMERVFDLWRQIWPAGAWLMTTDEGLQADTWQRYNKGHVVERGLFRGPGAAAEVANGALSPREPTP